MLLRDVVEHAPRHEAKIAGIDRHIGVTDAPHQPVEQCCRAAFEHGLALTLAAAAINDIRLGAVHQPPHLAEKLGRVLQIGVDGEDALAPASVQAGGHCKLMSVAARQIDRHHMRIAPRQAGHDRPGAIGRAVIQQNQLVVGAGRFRGRSRDAPVKFSEPTGSLP